jgi:DNA modification methylase
MESVKVSDDIELFRACALEWLPTLESESADFFFFDPPYPGIRRDYGFMGDEQWIWMMRRVVPECLRIVKPSGSILIVLQPGMEFVGRMRVIFYEFVYWVAKEFGLIQDAYWWNISALPSGEGAKREVGLLRPSIKWLLWLGNPNCYRNQNEILWQESKANLANRSKERLLRKSHSGRVKDDRRMADAAKDRGGVTPFNLFPVSGGARSEISSTVHHGASTPIELVDAWVRYACPAGGLVIDPFFGSGTTAYCCVKTGRKFKGCEIMAAYFDSAVKYLSEKII